MRTKLTIDRARWLRGESGQTSSLLRESDGKMCCLGFYGLALGIGEEDMLGLGDPSDVPAEGAWGDGLLTFDRYLRSNRISPLCEHLILTNDAEELSEPERESRIAAAFERIGVDVEFVG